MARKAEMNKKLTAAQPGRTAHAGGGHKVTALVHHTQGVFYKAYLSTAKKKPATRRPGKVPRKPRPWKPRASRWLVQWMPLPVKYMT